MSLPSTESKLVALPDGRKLAYYEFGDPSGAPLIHCHGGLVCGLDAGWADGVARERGIRLIAPNRPGLAGSDPQPGRTTADWAADVGHLADDLEIDRFIVAGWSMGGQYAIACAARMPERVVALGVLAGAPPLDDPATFAELNSMDHRFTLQSQHHPLVARSAFKGLAEIAEHTPRIYDDMVIHDLAGEGAAAARALGEPGLAAAFAPALSSTEGMVEEYVSWVKPWGFAPEDVSVPTHVFRGTEDELLPASWAVMLASRIPNAELHEIEGADHMLPLTRYGEIMDVLTG